MRICVTRKCKADTGMVETSKSATRNDCILQNGVSKRCSLGREIRISRRRTIDQKVPPERTVYYRMVYLNAVALAGRSESVEHGRLR
jgi:hypothetical protein